jgi:O-antigen/teichoic acid export membrane protein
MSIKLIFKNLNQRSYKAYKNILGLFTLKGINIAIGFVLVPLTLNYLDPTRYGIWITLSTIFNWFHLFDIGLGHGLRNKLAEAIAKNDFIKARTYVSTTYATFAAMFSGVFLFFIIINFFLDWTIILNTTKEQQQELSLLAGFVFFFFCMRFITNLIDTIALAKQEPAFSQLINVGGRALSLFGIYLLTIFTEGRLLYLGITLTAIPVFTSMFLSIFIFKKRYKEIQPAFKYIKFSELRTILNLGIKFFIIQIAAIVFYQTNNIIIAQLFGPEEVTPYSIAFQYFSIATFAFTTILSPYWSAFTDAYTKKEFNWIKRVMRNLRFIWLGLFLLVVILFMFSESLVHLWVGDKVVVQRDLYFVIAIYVSINAFLGIYSHFQNGVGKVMIQFYLAISLAIFHIPLAIFFSRQFGIKGIMFSTIIFGIIQIVIFHMQYIKIINQTDNKIWSK